MVGLDKSISSHRKDFNYDFFEDIDFLLTLYGKYSEVIHDGSIETIPNTLTENDIHLDITNYRQWKDSFIGRAKNWKKANGYDC